MKFKKKRKGIALISVLLILTAMMVMTMGFASYTMQDYFVSKTFQQSNTCFYLASAGMDYFVYLIKHNLLVYPYFTNSSDAYDANTSDGISANSQYGEIMNVYRESGDEVLLINKLTILSDDKLFNILDTSNACGTFCIRAWESHDTLVSSNQDSPKRMLVVTSTGYIRKVPNDKWNDDPTTWNTKTFQVIGQRTLIARIPYTKAELNFEGTENIPFANRSILIDGWFEKFR